MAKFEKFPQPEAYLMGGPGGHMVLGAMVDGPHKQPLLLLPTFWGTESFRMLSKGMRMFCKAAKAPGEQGTAVLEGDGPDPEWHMGQGCNSLQ